MNGDAVHVGTIDISTGTNLAASGQANMNGDTVHVGQTSLSTGTMNVLSISTQTNFAVADEGTPLTKRNTLNFAGAGVSCADDTDKTTCTIGSGGSAEPNYGQDFTNQTSVTLTHNLNSTDLIIQCYDAATPPRNIEWNTLDLTDADNATVTFTTSQSGHCAVSAGSGPTGADGTNGLPGITAVTTGTSSGFTGAAISSPTHVISFNQTQFKVSLQALATAFVQVDPSTFTMLGVDPTLGGALGGTISNATVDNDGHSHTGATLSGIDIGDDTNLAAGRSLTLSGDSVEADSELYTETKCSTIETPTSSDNFIVWRAPIALTVTGVDCIVESATSATLEMEECDTAGDTCSDIEAAITCDVDGATESGGVDNASIDAGDWIRMHLTAVSGTPGHITACLEYTVND